MRVVCTIGDKKHMTVEQAREHLGKDGIRKLMKPYLEIMLSMPGVKIEFKEAE